MATTAAGPARKSYMTKEQLETYLADLRNNRPKRPAGGRPLSTAARTRWSTVRSSMSANDLSDGIDLDDAINNGPPMLVSPTPPPNLTPRESKLIRKHSTIRHKRSSTTSSIRSFGSLRHGSGESGSGGASTFGGGADGESVGGGLDGQDERSGDALSGRPGNADAPSRPSALRRMKRDAAGSTFSGSSIRSLAGRVGPRPTTASSRSSTSSTHSDTKKKVMFGAESSGGRTSRPGSPTPSVVRMPPVHPPKPEEAPMIEKELALHFQMLGLQDTQTVAPLKINKVTAADQAARPQTSASSKAASAAEEKEAAAAAANRERSSTFPGRREFVPYQPKSLYVEPWTQDPTQHNKVQYTTNADSPPSPPMSENEREEVEAEILKDLGRRPLPRVAGPRGMTPPEDNSIRRNNTRYGSQIQPPAPPVIGIVTSTNPPPVQHAMRTQTSPAAPATAGASKPPMGHRATASGPAAIPSINVSGSRPLGPSVSASTPSVPTVNVSSSSRPSAPSINVSSPSVPSINVSSSRPSAPSINVSSASVPSINVSSSRPSAPSINVSSASVPSINVSGSTPSVPSISVSNSTPAVPTISFPDDPTPSVPSISFPDDPTPSISASSTTSSHASARPLPRPRPSPSVTSNSSTRSLTGRGNATCNHCREPIQGRIVSATSLRFHPSCFRCAHCATSLEHVGFFPEPAEARKTRLAASPAADTASPGIRFYCHLDFHELFSPRCKSCKTPIEGEVVVACGSTWHQGHFFCAECGDPFDKSSRFVEKDGYAWCVGCYAKRFSGKCRKCRKPVLETVVKALGAEWHEDCFCCTECGGAFEDGRFFVRGEGGKESPVCVKCEERRLKM